MIKINGKLIKYIRVLHLSADECYVIYYDEKTGSEDVVLFFSYHDIDEFIINKTD